MLNIFADSNYTYTTSSYSSSGPIHWGIILIFLGFYAVIALLMIISFWKVFTKAGKPGWASFIPIYNIWIIFELTGYPGWWSLLLLVPLVNLFPSVIALMAYYKLGQLFGKSSGFSVCLVLFPYITFPMLAFGSAQFIGNNDTGLGDHNFMPPQPMAGPPQPQMQSPQPMVTPQPQPVVTSQPQMQAQPPQPMTAPPQPQEQPPPPQPPTNTQPPLVQ